ncbi:MAG: 2-oxoacid:acceptor oxidoreductase family protein [Deltaproteobacteria bacterium]|nr:2-oxoacid:acceptor oxidoreductase family protein [Deltaproteobacteria bacterium]
MLEIRWHGRGGQGAVTSVELLALAAIGEGKFAQGFPSFGPERRGAPVAAFNRINDRRIKSRAGIYQPDVVAVLDESLIDLVNVVEGLKSKGTLIVNTQKTAKQLAKATGFKGRIGVVDAKGIALKEMGVPIANTTMIGALIKATGAVKLESMKSPIEQRFGRIADRNMNAMTRAYNEIKIS